MSSLLVIPSETRNLCFSPGQPSAPPVPTPFAFGAKGSEIRSQQYNNGAMNIGQKLW
jgi:hypothetical protein